MRWIRVGGCTLARVVLSIFGEQESKREVELEKGQHMQS
jgi:hypothetical protein